LITDLLRAREPYLPEIAGYSEKTKVPAAGFGGKRIGFC